MKSREKYNTVNMERNTEERIFWINELKNGFEPTTLPETFSCTKKSVKKSCIEYQIEKKLSDSITKVCNNNSIAVYTYITTIINITLFNYLGDEYNLIATRPIDPAKKKNEDLILLKTFLEEKDTLKQVLNKTQKKLQSINQQKNYQLDQVAKDLGIQLNINLQRDSLFNIIVLNEDVHSTQNIDQYKDKLILKFKAAKDGFTFNFEYNERIFHRQVIKNFACHIENTIRNSISNPDETLSSIQFLSADETIRLVNEPAHSKTDLPYTSIPEIFEKMAQRHADKTGAIFSVDFSNVGIKYGFNSDQFDVNIVSDRLSYTDINSKANQLAWYLREQGVKPNSVVGIYLDFRMKWLLAF